MNDLTKTLREPEEELFYAVDSEDKRKLKELLKMSVNPNVIDEKAEPLIVSAVSKKDNLELKNGQMENKFYLQTIILF